MTLKGYSKYQMTNPPQSTELPLFFVPHGEMEEINYMRHLNKAEWDLNALKDPIYLYQPTVTPDRNGGTVYDPIREYRNSKNQEFIDVRKEYIKNPKEEAWMMYSSDGQAFKGLPDTLNSTAVIIPESSQITIQLVDNSIRVTDEKYTGETTDSKALADLHQRDLKRQQNQFEKAFQPVADSIKHREHLKAERAKEIKRTGGEDVINESDDEANDPDHYNDDEQGADFVDDEQDDEDSAQEEVVEDVEDLLRAVNEELENENDFDENEEEDKDESKKKKKKTEKPENTGDAPSAPINTKEILEEVFGKECVKEDELVRFIQDQGFVTQRDLIRKFRSKLETPEQKQAFAHILNKRAVKFTDKGLTRFKLR